MPCPKAVCRAPSRVRSSRSASGKAAWSRLADAVEGMTASPGRTTVVPIFSSSVAIRMVPPLALCVVLAARGVSGRDHLAFIFYLLGFYLVALALETWTSVARVAAATEQTNSLQG